MLRLAFYSDQIIPENQAVDKVLLATLASEGSGKKIGYIASGPEPDRRYFDERRAYYRRLDLDLCVFYDLDQPWSQKQENLLFQCDAIHLAGGHTGQFLTRLKRSGLISRLRTWASEGGLLIGTSAGAIILTPTIATDALFVGKSPQDVMKETALDLVPFEFFPHMNSNPSYLPALVEYSTQTPRPIIACNDGDGLVVTNGWIVCIGKPVWVEGGQTRPACSVMLNAVSASV